MKRIVPFVLLFFALNLSAQTCEQVTDRLLDKLNTTSLQTDFSISITEPESQSLNYSGSMLIYGKQFSLRMMTMQAYYNGKTLWVYDNETKEVNISEPTDEELTESNPFLLIRLVREHCWLHFTDDFKDKTQWSVDFYPQDKKSEILKYTIRFNRSNLIPTHIIISELHDKKTTIILSGQKYGVDTTNRFTFDTTRHPDAIINDLR